MLFCLVDAPGYCRGCSQLTETLSSELQGLKHTNQGELMASPIYLQWVQRRKNVSRLEILSWVEETPTDVLGGGLP